MRSHFVSKECWTGLVSAFQSLWAAMNFSVRGLKCPPSVKMRIAEADCLSCAVRADCTRAKAGARTVTLRPQAQHQAIQAARKNQETPEFKEQYAKRAGVEGTILKALGPSDYVAAVTEGKLKLDYRILLPQQLSIWFGFGIGGVELRVKATVPSRFATLAPD